MTGLEHLNGDGLPWSTKPVPWPIPAPAPMRQQRIVRHFGRRGAYYPNDYELLPVWTDHTGQLPENTLQDQPEQVRAIMGGGSVRTAYAAEHLFRKQEIAPRSPLVFGELTTRSREYPPADVEGPRELVFVWDSYQPPPAGLGGAS